MGHREQYVICYDCRTAEGPFLQLEAYNRRARHGEHYAWVEKEDEKGWEWLERIIPGLRLNGDGKKRCEEKHVR